MKKAVIFDMDGVLIDSNEIVWESFGMLLKEKNISLNDDQIKKYLGRSLRDQINLWTEDFGVKFEYKDFGNKAWNIQKKLIKGKVTVNKNLVKFLNELKENDIKMGVGTSSSKSRSVYILKTLGIYDFFSVLVSANDIENHKPDPEVFLKVAEKLNVNSKDCVVIEDAVNGILAANKAGMKSVAYLTPFHTRGEFSSLADLTINDFSEINKDIIGNL